MKDRAAGTDKVPIKAPASGTSGSGSYNATKPKCENQTGKSISNAAVLDGLGIVEELLDYKGIKGVAKSVSYVNLGLTGVEIFSEIKDDWNAGYTYRAATKIATIAGIDALATGAIIVNTAAHMAALIPGTVSGGVANIIIVANFIGSSAAIVVVSETIKQEALKRANSIER